MKIIGLGEVMMRLSNPLDISLNRSQDLKIYFGGGEYNTLVNLSGLGYETEMVTQLPNNVLSERIQKEAQAYGVGMKHVGYTDGRLGTYYAILGDALTATAVIYDRANSCFAQSKELDYNFEEIFKDAELFHVSGITAALTENTRSMTLSTIKKAKSMGLKVSYDSNYRAKLWSQTEAGTFLKEVLAYVDYAFLGLLDMKYLLNMKLEDLDEGYAQLKSSYPQIQYLASTNRQVITPYQHELSVNIYDSNLYQTEKVKLPVLDRIGGGDVFTAGILDGILSGKSKKEIAHFALADTMIKHSRLGDNCFISRREVESVMQGASLAIER